MNQSLAGSPAPSSERPIRPYERRTVAVGPWDRDAKGGWIVETGDRLGIARAQAARRAQEADR